MIPFVYNKNCNLCLLAMVFAALFIGRSKCGFKVKK